MAEPVAPHSHGEAATTSDGASVQQASGEGLPEARAREGLLRVRAALAAAGREGQDASELRSVLNLARGCGERAPALAGGAAR